MQHTALKHKMNTALDPLLIASMLLCQHTLDDCASVQAKQAKIKQIKDSFNSHLSIIKLHSFECDLVGKAACFVNLAMNFVVAVQGTVVFLEQLILGQMLHNHSARLEGNVEIIVTRLLSAPLTVVNAMRDDCSEHGFKVYSYGLLLGPCYFPGGQIGGFVDLSLFWEKHWRAQLNSFKSAIRLNFEL